MNEDNLAVVDGLRDALADGGLTQSEFAAALGTSASRFSAYLAGKTTPSAALYLRALRLAASLKAARKQGWMTPQSTTREIRGALRQGDTLWALKMTLQGRDHLRELLHARGEAATAWTTTPPTTGDPKWDALLAALTEQEFNAADRQPPEWTRTEDKHLNAQDEWVLPSLLLDESAVRAATPDWLAAHGIYAAERDLATA
ncbi:MAG: helix-turn-helix transcriptional regulator [Knoellia sp.]